MTACAYFSGITGVQEKLVSAVRDALDTSRMKPEDLDDICGFGEPAVEGQLQLPRTAEVLQDASKMHSHFFGIASFILGLKVNEVLRPALSPQQRGEVIRFMADHGFGLQYATGANSDNDVSLSQQAELFVALRALDEVDGAATHAG